MHPLRFFFEKKQVLVQDQLVALFYALTEAQDSLEKLYRIYGARFDSVSSTGEAPLRARKDSVVTQRKKNASELYFEQGAKEPRKFAQTFAAQYDGINKSINTQLKLLANHVQTELKAENQVIERDTVEWFGDILLGEAIWRAAERAQNELGSAPQKLKTIAPNSLEGVLKGYSAYRNAKGMNFSFGKLMRLVQLYSCISRTPHGFFLKKNRTSHREPRQTVLLCLDSGLRRGAARLLGCSRTQVPSRLHPQDASRRLA